LGTRGGLIHRKEGKTDRSQSAGTRPLAISEPILLTFWFTR
jgi:hypothetical protein